MNPFALPHLPPWDGAHPIVVHFPVAILSVTPLFLVLAAVWKSRAREMMLAASLLAVVGTVGVLLALASGEAGEGAALGVYGAQAVLHDHEEMAELARTIFLILTPVTIGATIALWKLHAKVRTPARIGAALVLLAGWGAGCLVLANAAHLGGRLVHQVGVLAPIMGKGAEMPPTGESDGMDVD